MGSLLADRDADILLEHEAHAARVLQDVMDDKIVSLFPDRVNAEPDGRTKLAALSLMKKLDEQPMKFLIEYVQLQQTVAALVKSVGVLTDRLNGGEGERSIEDMRGRLSTMSSTVAALSFHEAH